MYEITSVSSNLPSLAGACVLDWLGGFWLDPTPGEVGVRGSRCWIVWAAGLAGVISGCAQSANVTCPAGEQLSADGIGCESITCIGGQVEGNSCICPGDQIPDRGICRDPDDPCIEIECNDANPCTDDVCAEAACSFEPVADGRRCQVPGGAGVCLSGSCEQDPCARVDCDDGNECTVDGVCDSATATCRGGRDAADGASCRFGSLPGVCDSRVCVDAMLCAGQDCDDGDPCTDDLCDPGTGQCSNPPVPELSSCELDGVLGECIDQMCVGLCEDAATRCNDGSACTIDSCDLANGCENAPKNCSDGNSCTDDGCNTANGSCINTTRADGSSCTLNCPIGQILCVPIRGTCQSGSCRTLIIIRDSP